MVGRQDNFVDIIISKIIREFFIKKMRLPAGMTGLVSLFMLAHFGHHMIGAMLSPLLPFIRNDLNLNYTEAGIILSAFSLAGGLSQLPAGYLADRFGQRLLITIGISGVAVTAVFIGLSNSFMFLTISLILAAVLGGGYHSAAATVVSGMASEKYRGRALGFHLIGGTSCMWVVPLIAAPIAAALSWRASYFILAVPAFIIGMLVFFLLKKQTFRRQITVEQVQNAGRDKFNWHKLIPVMAMVIGGNLMMMSVTSYLSLYGVDHLGLTKTAAGLLTSLIPGIGLIGAPLGGYLSDRFGDMKILILMNILLAPLLFVIGQINTLIPILVILILLGMVSSICMPTSEAFIVGNTPSKRRSTVLGVYFFSGAGLAGLVTPLMGNLIDRHGFEYTYTVASIVAAIITVVAVIYLRINYRLVSQQGQST